MESTASTRLPQQLRHSSAPSPAISPSMTTSAASSALDSLLSQSAAQIAATPMPSSRPPLACCCGREECAYLKHNDAALDGLERSVQTAAQLGQALLVRHEAYMADAEEERQMMNATIEKLELEKRDMEAENAKTVEENRNLLNQLEELNTSAAESDAHIKALTETLESTQREMQRLAGLASRTASLEVQLVTMEQERAELQQSLASCEEEERSAVQRWKKAERTLSDLHEQIERIEAEAEEEQKRHVEVVGRLERRREVEREMAHPTRSGGAMTLEKGRPGGNVVSHFVKDILQDNANLQLGIVELRELLTSSNEEVQHLQEQLILHQPVASPTTIKSPSTHNKNGQNRVISLGEELSSIDPPKTISQELHVHHHYHQAERLAAKDKFGPLKRVKRRPRVTASPNGSGVLSPPPELQALTEYSRPSTHHHNPSTASTILSQTSVSIPPTVSSNNHNRWSTQSNQTALSSVPSSPTTSPYYHHRRDSSSIFDRAFPTSTDTELSRPTSPESNAPGSPIHGPTNLYNSHKPRDLPSATSFPFHPLPATHSLDPPTDESPILSQDSTPRPPSPSRSRLPRSSSHDSLLSISGMDIHAPNHAPTQTIRPRASHHTLLLRTRPLPSPWLPSFSSASSTTSSSSLTHRAPVLAGSATSAMSTPIASLTSTTATFSRPSLGGVGRHDSHAYTQGLLQTDSASPAAASDSVGRRAGAWVWSPWGVASGHPHPHAAPAGETDGESARARGRRAKDREKERQRLLRPPGVNQMGPVKGLLPRVREVDVKVQLEDGGWDEEGLRDALGE